jgi:hypothetical protein
VGPAVVLANELLDNLPFGLAESGPGGWREVRVDLADPRRLEFDYVQRLADIVDSVAEPAQRLRVVHVGGAGMSLPRYVAATRPTSAQLVLEPDIELTAFVRRHLPLPVRSGIKVRGTDGRRGIAELRNGYADLVIIDAFVGARWRELYGTALAEGYRFLSFGDAMLLEARA